MNEPAHPPQRLVWFGPVVLAGLCLFQLPGELDPAGTSPLSAPGPGLTLDESFNVTEGLYLVRMLRQSGLAVLHPATLQDIYSHREFEPGYKPDHPPLGRLWLGLAHELTLFRISDPQPGAYYVVLARAGSATAFALLVLLVGVQTGRWHGPPAGSFASLALILLPRVFGHAHLAALETVMNLTYALALFTLLRWVDQPTHRRMLLAGCCLGLALLTKIQGVLLVPPVTLVLLWHRRWQGVVPLLIWGGTGFLVFFLGWPWLWIDPLTHLADYFARTTERAHLSVWYFGTKYPDNETPWHYPWVCFLLTIPLGTLALGAAGLVSNRIWQREAVRDHLLLGGLLFPLVLFSVPGIAAYDGVRLFLVVFPLWAVYAGCGAERLRQALQARLSPRLALLAVVGLLLGQSWGIWSTRPCYLSYYNALTGGLRGADRIGMDRTYWGDSLTGPLLQTAAEQLPPQRTLHLTPVVHQFYLDALQSQAKPLNHAGIRLQPWIPEDENQNVQWLLVFYRQADLSPRLPELLGDTPAVAEVRRSGVLLAALYHLDPVDPERMLAEE